MRLKLLSLSVAAALTGAACSSEPAEQAPAPTAASTAKPALNIKPFGTADPNFKPDYSSLDPAIAKTFEHIDQNIDFHVGEFQRWLQQPSISNSGEGIPESAEMVKGFFDELGCQYSRVYDTGLTEYGSPGNPVTYAYCNEGQPKTVAFWWQADTMPVTQVDNWIAPPFEARIVSGEEAVVPTASRVVIARGATNSKGRHAAQLAAFRSMRAAMGKFPVNLIFVVEFDEERMDIGLRKFFQDHSDLMQEADALFRGGDSEGAVAFELTTSGKAWGRGPVLSDIHGAQKRTVDSPAWRHMEMLASLVDDNGNRILIDGFHQNKEEPTAAQIAEMKEEAAGRDLEASARQTGVARYIWDDPYQVIYGGSFGTSFNLDGIWGGNMYAGGAGAILPSKVTSKHNFRYVPRMNGLDIVKKLRAQLDKNGYKDVELSLVGDVPWSRGSKDPNNDMTQAHRASRQTMQQIGLMAGPAGEAPVTSASAELPRGRSNDLLIEPSGGYWPSYLWTDGEVGEKIGTVFLPMGTGDIGGGGGGRAHASNEYYTVEAINKQGGFAFNAKSVVLALHHFAQINNTPPRPKGVTKFE
jgi:acetylornithine deacetylase/succinyl-diaminopimelate desuccinylase-like protein